MKTTRAAKGEAMANVVRLMSGSEVTQLEVKQGQKIAWPWTRPVSAARS